MKTSFLLKLIRIWPPFLGAGIRVLSFKPDLSEIVVQMKLRFWNKNYVGTHFGGSLYSMTDPFYMLMLLKLLGSDYIVWDKLASIRYRKPARGKVFAHFKLTQEQVASIRAQVDSDGKAEPVFKILIHDADGVMVAEVEKMLHVSKKKTPSTTSGRREKS